MPDIIINANQIEWMPEAAKDPDLYFCGPSHNARVTSGDSHAAQFSALGMGSALFFGASHKLSFSIKEGNEAAYFHPTFLPKVYLDRNGQITLKGTGVIEGKSMTASMFLSGKTDGETFYIVLDLLNNTGETINLTPTLIWSSGNLQNFRGDFVGHFGAADTDSISWDSANQYLEITSPEIANIWCGIRACSLVQHYCSQKTDINVNTTYLATGDLPDLIGPRGAENYIWLQHGATKSETVIAAGEAGRFVWAVAYKTSQSGLQTLMASLNLTPAQDIAEANATYTPDRMSVQVSPSLDRLFSMSQGIMSSMGRSQIINSRIAVPAGTYTYTFPFARDGYYSTKSLLQMSGGAALVFDDYYLFKSHETADHAQQHEIAQYVKNTGRFVESRNNGTPGDQDFYQILKAYEYYLATQDATFLTNEISTLNNIGCYLNTFYTANPKYLGMFAGHGDSCYPDGANNFSGETFIHEPMISSLAPYTFRRLAELNTVAGHRAQAATWVQLAKTMAANLSELWNPSTNWCYVNVTPTGKKFSNQHLTSLDLALWGELQTAYCGAMAARLIETSDWWDETNLFFREMPTTDSQYSAGSYWLGEGWHLTDFKAFETVFRFGTKPQAETAWRNLERYARHRLETLRGYLGERYFNSGMFGFSIGAMQEMIVRGIFGIDAHAAYFTIAPNTNKLNGEEFKLIDLKMGNQNYHITVRGAGSIQKTYVNGVLHNPGPIPYSDETAISVEFSGQS